MAGWPHRLNGHEFEQTLGDNEGQKSHVLQSMGSQRAGHDWVTEQHTRLKIPRGWDMYTLDLHPGHHRPSHAARDPCLPSPQTHRHAHRERKQIWFDWGWGAGLVFHKQTRYRELSFLLAALFHSFRRSREGLWRRKNVGWTFIHSFSKVSTCSSLFAWS